MGITETSGCMEAGPQDHRIAVVCGDLEMTAYFEVTLKSAGYSLLAVQKREEILGILSAATLRIGAVVFDLVISEPDGIDTLRQIRLRHPTLPVIVTSDPLSPSNIVLAMKSGASDFLCKPLSPEEFCGAIKRALEGLPKHRNATGAAWWEMCKTPPFVGTSRRIREIRSVIRDVGWSEAPVLIQGETGTGKEVIARELHAHSPRANNVFLKLNCAALPSELVESELFGYERGAFTGAFQRKSGMFEDAHGGTIFLDEIGDMDVSLQAKLLQVLQDQEFQRVGGKGLISVDVRVMAATHQDLDKSIANGRFREDLFYRLNVINLHLPPLRERPEDIIELAEYLLRKHAVSGKPAPSVTPALKQAFLTYRWPGNIREMENLVRRLIVLGNPEQLARGLNALTDKPIVSSSINGQNSNQSAGTDSTEPILEEVTRNKRRAERDAILAALNATNWHRKHAAALLEIDYKALLYKMKKLGIDNASGHGSAGPEGISFAGSAAGRSS